MPEMHLRWYGFTDSACESLTKKKEQIQKVLEIGHIFKWCCYKCRQTCYSPKPATSRRITQGNY